MSKTEQDIFIGPRRYCRRELYKATAKHFNHTGAVTKLEWRRLAFRTWFCLLEFEHN